MKERKISLSISGVLILAGIFIMLLSSIPTFKYIGNLLFIAGFIWLLFYIFKGSSTPSNKKTWFLIGLFLIAIACGGFLFYFFRP
ncbi:hypothetical protein KDK_33270 [Dictyobacter kobayashii]|uniref:Uncharacterized protein n=1 Tax=Dictyobacter kobayashii TaxID=2014872 RepID=A0A402AK65_9CHLR|nr:hypothetical protein KDK_33270 [Dictyobacter kobayashii]